MISDLTAYRYKHVRAFLPFSLDRDEENIARHKARGWEEVPYGEEPQGLSDPGPGLVLYRIPKAQHALLQEQHSARTEKQLQEVHARFVNATGGSVEVTRTEFTDKP